MLVLTKQPAVVREAIEALKSYDHTRSPEGDERFIWEFCDVYLELVKARAYGQSLVVRSAHAALRLALGVQLRLFAPVLPFVTEEVWSWWRDGSIHRAPWPTEAELPDGGDPAVMDGVAEVLGRVRKAKSEAKVSMRAEVSRLTVETPAFDAIRAAQDDLCAAGNVEEFVLTPSAS